MKQLLLILGFCVSVAYAQFTFVSFESVAVGDSVTLQNGVDWASIDCVSCRIVQYGDTIFITNSIVEFPDYQGEAYKAIEVKSLSGTAKIMFRYADH